MIRTTAKKVNSSEFDYDWDKDEEAGNQNKGNEESNSGFDPKIQPRKCRVPIGGSPFKDRKAL